MLWPLPHLADAHRVALVSHVVRRRVGETHAMRMHQEGEALSRGKAMIDWQIVRVTSMRPHSVATAAPRMVAPPRSSPYPNPVVRHRAQAEVYDDVQTDGAGNTAEPVGCPAQIRLHGHGGGLANLVVFLKRPHRLARLARVQVGVGLVAQADHLRVQQPCSLAMVSSSSATGVQPHRRPSHPSDAASGCLQPSRSARDASCARRPSRSTAFPAPPHRPPGPSRRHL
eukprot:scaffold4396_cov196-Pinguiococcus_pyrenoidosus.AAC.4